MRIGGNRAEKLRKCGTAYPPPYDNPVAINIQRNKNYRVNQERCTTRPQAAPRTTNRFAQFDNLYFDGKRINQFKTTFASRLLQLMPEHMFNDGTAHISITGLPNFFITALKKSCMAGRNIGKKYIIAVNRLIRCCFSSFCGVSTYKFNRYPSSQASADPTSDVHIVAFPFSIYFITYVQSFVPLFTSFFSPGSVSKPYFPVLGAKKCHI